VKETAYLDRLESAMPAEAGQSPFHH
jgi:hypothetical protein